MFGVEHYVPVVRWKQAERLALRRLGFDEKQHMTPLIELTPRILVKPEPALLKVVDEIASDWGHASAFLDVRHLGPTFRSQAGFHPLTLMAPAARSEKLDLIYVSPLRPSREFLNALRTEIERDGRGVS